ncbi:MAG: endolytic transglycosylase MltG, partial [Candidatus Krumholzibacteria bacterium]|nr:endolytic transglycosylase MltG [Candidatus Krumholzibacteria bacterium]
MGCVTVTIPRGASFAAAVDSLAAHGVIGSRLAFTAYARLRGLPAELKSGTYRFPAGARYGDVARTLEVGRGVEVRWSVPEGLMLTEVARSAQLRLGIPAESVLAAARDPATLAALQLTGIASSAEGYLYPTTYQLPVGIDARGLLAVMAAEFRDHWSPAWDVRLAELGMSRHQVVTLASIVEAEVRYGPDREYVAAVYHNRLRRGMPLQADPTVIYAHGRRLPRVWERHLRIASPYNTYLHAGLPPGPISQPGSASLEAALYPNPSPYLYFVAQADGKHVFSTTYQQH